MQSYDQLEILHMPVNNIMMQLQQNVTASSMRSKLIL